MFGSRSSSRCSDSVFQRLRCVQTRTRLGCFMLGESQWRYLGLRFGTPKLICIARNLHFGIRNSHSQKRWSYRICRKMQFRKFSECFGEQVERQKTYKNESGLVEEPRFPVHCIFLRQNPVLKIYRRNLLYLGKFAKCPKKHHSEVSCT